MPEKTEDQSAETELVAVLDLGTNTFNLLLAECQGNSWSEVFACRIPVKLGQGAIHEGFIAADRFARGIDALIVYRQMLHNYGCSKSVVLATSAIRDAENGKRFIEAAKEFAGFDIRAISGDEEAELIYDGVIQSLPQSEDTDLIMDIGGGSTEFIIGSSGKILWKMTARNL